MIENNEIINLYIDKMQAVVTDFEGEQGRKPRALVITHGCQMNARDSETISGFLEKMGYAQADGEQDADLVVFNTCCVRENAENKLYGNLGNLKKIKESNPNFKIILCGCMMQQDVVIEKIKNSYNFVDLIFGTHNIHRFSELLYSVFETKSQIVDIWKDAKEIIEDLPALREYPFKAGVNIMYGCDNYCTFCIVPYVRGKERSRQPDDIIREIENLAADGVFEVMLLGQNVDSYGKGLDGINFANLLQMVAKVDGIRRIRFMSSHPKDITDEVIQVMSENENICKQLHLPIQAGSTRLLQKMNRGYSKEYYLDLVQKVREKMPNIALTTDIMVGFPGETEEDFLETLDLIKRVRFSTVFTFIYSKRIGTPAARMDNQIPADIIKERFSRLLTAVNDIIFEINAAQVGKILEVIPEAIDEQGILKARADDNTLVHFKGDKSLIAQEVSVKVTDAKTFYVNGELL